MSKKERHKVGMLIDGTFSALLCTVYAYYYERLYPYEIQLSAAYQPSLGLEYVAISTNEDKATRVLEALRKKLNTKSLQNIEYAFCNRDEERYLTLFKYIVAGFKLGKALDNHMQTDYVLKTQQLAHNTSGEVHSYKGFARFRELQGGVFYSDISPENDCLPFLAEHFSDRFCGSRFILHDVRRNTAVIYDGTQWMLCDVPPESVARLDKMAQTDIYTDLWQVFYNAIGIEQRHNHKLRRSMMPKRYWRHLPEMNQR